MAGPISALPNPLVPNLRHDNTTLLLDVMICHVSDVPVTLIARGEAKEPHVVYFNNPIPMDQGQ